MATLTAETPVQHRRCAHNPPCPPANAADHDAARVVNSHHDQGWVLLCNGVIVFDDTGELLPDRRPVAPHRPECPHGAGWASGGDAA